MAPYSGRASKQEFSFHMVGWGASTGEASSPLRSLLATFNREKGLGAVNWGRYSNPKVDYVIEQALQQVDDENRRAMLQQATKLSMDDLGIMPVHFQYTIWATKKGVAYTPRTDEYTLAFQFYTSLNTQKWAGPTDFGTDGGVHNFLRYLEDWGGQTSNYMGSMVSLYYVQYATGSYKCCGTVYNPPTRNYQFDVDFQDPTKMPPGTPMFEDLVNVGFQQVF